MGIPKKLYEIPYGKCFRLVDGETTYVHCRGDGMWSWVAEQGKDPDDGYDGKLYIGENVIPVGNQDD